jgi:ligand-binding SRPBCC domain-containing protein
MATYRLETSQEINASMTEVWDFISSPRNLKHITPQHMGFEILTPNLPEKMYPGMMIEYIVKPLFGIPMNWLTEITHVKELDYFVDEQRSGPYTMWHHQHKIEKIESGVLMTDIVHYIPPMGFIGSIANAIVIKNQLKQIFDYRTTAVDKKFPKQ